MKFLTLKNNFLALSFLALTSLSSGLVTACTTSQNQAEAPKTTDVSDKQMNHGAMNHSMSMDLGPADANFDLRFIDAMIPHHQGATEMAKEALQKSKRPEIKKLADNIIQAQNQEIQQMQQWRKTWYANVGDKPMVYDTKMGHTMEMSSEQKQSMMMSMDLGAADSEFDLRFIDGMIPHHQGAVTMATEALNKSKRPEIKKLAQEIIASQNAEINQMKQWRKAWYNK